MKGYHSDRTHELASKSEGKEAKSKVASATFWVGLSASKNLIKTIPHESAPADHVSAGSRHRSGDNQHTSLWV